MRHVKAVTALLWARHEPAHPWGVPETLTPAGAVEQDPLAGLSPRAVHLLAGLYGVPPSITAATIQLVPAEIRPELVTHGIVSRAKDGQGDETLRLTADGYTTIAAAAAREDGTIKATATLARQLE